MNDDSDSMFTVIEVPSLSSTYFTVNWVPYHHMVFCLAQQANDLKQLELYCAKHTFGGLGGVMH